MMVGRCPVLLHQYIYFTYIYIYIGAEFILINLHRALRATITGKNFLFYILFFVFMHRALRAAIPGQRFSKVLYRYWLYIVYVSIYSMSFSKSYI